MKPTKPPGTPQSVNGYWIAATLEVGTDRAYTVTALTKRRDGSFSHDHISYAPTQAAAFEIARSLDPG